MTGGKIPCSKCKEYYPPTPVYFHRNKQRPSGLRTECKKCSRLIRVKYYYAHKAEANAYSRTYYQANKRWINQYAREYRQSPRGKARYRAHYKRNKEKIIARANAWRRRQPDYYEKQRLYHRRRQLRKAVMFMRGE